MVLFSTLDLSDVFYIGLVSAPMFLLGLHMLINTRQAQRWERRWYAAHGKPTKKVTSRLGIQLLGLGFVTISIFVFWSLLDIWG